MLLQIILKFSFCEILHDGDDDKEGLNDQIKANQPRLGGVFEVEVYYTQNSNCFVNILSSHPVLQ